MKTPAAAAPAATDQPFRLRSIAVSAYGPSVLFGLSQGAMLPVIAVTALDRGASVALASLVAALVGIGSLLSNIPAGVATTRFGERRSMVFAAALTALALLPALADVGLWPFAAGVLLAGVASSVFTLARQAYLTDAVPAGMRARALSTLGGSQRIGMFVGPFLASALIRVWGTRAAYLVAVAAIVAAGLIALTVRDIDRQALGAGTGQAPLSTRQMLRRHRRTFATVGVGVLLLSGIRASRQVVVPLWAHHIGLDAATISLIYGISGAVDAATFYPAGLAMDRWGRRAVAVPSTLVMGASFVAMAFTHGAVTLAVAAVAMGLGNGIGSGIVMTLGADVSPTLGRPTFLGLWREVADAGSGLGPLLLSATTAVAGLPVAVTVCGGLGFAAAAALWRWIPHPRPSP